MNMSLLLSTASSPTGCYFPWWRSGSLRRFHPTSDAATNVRIETTISPANGNTLNDILADPISRKHLFPDGIMRREVDVFDAHASNAHLVTQGCSAILVSGRASLM